MADITRCDRCHAESPDPVTGLHVANHWIEVAPHKRRDNPHKTNEKIYCTECWKAIERVMREPPPRTLGEAVRLARGGDPPSGGPTGYA